MLFSRVIESDGFVRTGEELSPRRRARQRKTALPSHRQGKDTDDKIPVFIPLYYQEIGDDEFVNEAAWDAIGRDGSRLDRHQLHYLLSDHALSG